MARSKVMVDRVVINVSLERSLKDKIVKFCKKNKITITSLLLSGITDKLKAK
jgi:hypothetical protein